MDVSFPLRLGPHGRVVDCAYEEHVAQLIEQVLFTRPGERVNRPQLGCGLEDVVFEPAGSGTSAALTLTLQAELDQWLGDLIGVDDVRVSSDDGTLTVVVEYTLKSTRSPKTATFVR